MKYRFLADYRHRWPSRAHTEYKAGMVMTLKREVVDYCLPRGMIEPVRASGGYVNAPLVKVGNGDREHFTLSEDETQDALIAAAPKPTRTRRRVTDGK